ncbi:hypothetical protein IH781_03365 [Patescibacteria group bacterium]|nr:hypothetical protein [Patescibacteria group bacterium]
MSRIVELSLPKLTITAAVLLGAVIAFQYPAATTFPAGGDPVRHIARAQAIVSAFDQSINQGFATTFTNSAYPGSTFILSLTTLIPISWPDRFVFLMASAHLLTGISIGWLLGKISGWPAAAAGIAFWSLTTIGITDHFEDGTLAQLLSLPLVLLFLERLYSKHHWWALIVLLLTIAVHPLSGVILLITLSTTTPILLWYLLKTKGQARRTALVLLSAIALMATTSTLFLYWQGILRYNIEPDSRTINLINLLKSHLGPALILAPLGFALILAKARRQPIALGVLLTFIIASLLLGFNDLLNYSIQTFRFQSYFILSVVITASLALPTLLMQAFPSPWLRRVFAVTLFLTLATVAFKDAAFIYARYESPTLYLRLDKTEQEAIVWLKQNLPSESVVVSTDLGRHSEWIPVLAGVRHTRLSEENRLFQAPTNQLNDIIGSSNYTHLVFFLKREPISANFVASSDAYPVIYQNKGVVIINLRP